jgi:homoserine O-acetyltransferase
MAKDLCFVKTQNIAFDEPFSLESGKVLPQITIAYETYGGLNAQRNNAVLILHAFSANAHAAGYLEGEDKPGWWDDLIGQGKPFDTDKYFVICSNVLGGCKGSTGPSSINPETNKPYGLDFPVITMLDIVNAQKKLIDHLGIKKLLSVCGGSMGGMQALQWVATYPDMVVSAIPIATAWKHSSQQIAFDEVGRQAVMADPDWNNGDYYNTGRTPEKGLAVARMIGHITYMSDKSMEEKFARKLKQDGYTFSFNADFEVESYLRYRGGSFVKRFDANSYLYITKAMDYFDLSGSKLIPDGESLETRFLVVGFKSDWLYPTYQSRELVTFLKSRSVDVSYCEVESTYGHDAFLLEIENEGLLVRHFLEKIFKSVCV